MAVFAYPSFLFFILGALGIDDWMLTGNVIIFLSLLSLLICGVLILSYPIFLFIKQQKSDAIVVFASTAVTLAIILVSFYIAFGQIQFPD